MSVPIPACAAGAMATVGPVHSESGTLAHGAWSSLYLVQSSCVHDHVVDVPQGSIDLVLKLVTVHEVLDESTVQA